MRGVECDLSLILGSKLTCYCALRVEIDFVGAEIDLFFVWLSIELIFVWVVELTWFQDATRLVLVCASKLTWFLCGRWQWT